jgi:hypothetical protein
MNRKNKKYFAAQCVLLIWFFILFLFYFPPDRASYGEVFRYTPEIYSLRSYHDLISAEVVLEGLYDPGFLFFFSLLKSFLSYDFTYLGCLFAISFITVVNFREHGKGYFLPLLLYVSLQSYIDAQVLRQSLAQGIFVYGILNKSRMSALLSTLFHKSLLLLTPFAFLKTFFSQFIFFFALSSVLWFASSYLVPQIEDRIGRV